MIRRYDEVIANKCNKHVMKVFETHLQKSFNGQKLSLQDYVTDWNESNVDQIN